MPEDLGEEVSEVVVLIVGGLCEVFVVERPHRDAVREGVTEEGWSLTASK